MSSGNSSAASPIRILRAIEETADNETIETRDFQILAEYLKLSDVWSPMAGNDGILKSDDNVIPLRGVKISEIENLVRWMKRDKEFLLDNSTFRYLAELSNKYHIPRLLEDIHQYTFRFIYERFDQNIELWKFAAFYGFPELFDYCMQSWCVCQEIVSILQDPSKGLTYFIRDCQLPLKSLHHLVFTLALSAGRRERSFEERLHMTAKDNIQLRQSYLKFPK